MLFSTLLLGNVDPGRTTDTTVAKCIYGKVARRSIKLFVCVRMLGGKYETSQIVVDHFGRSNLLDEPPTKPFRTNFWVGASQ